MSKVSDMTREDLEQLDEIIQGLHKGITESNKLKAGEKAQEVSDFCRESIEEMREINKKKGVGIPGVGKIMDMFRLDLADPLTVFSGLGKKSMEIMDNLVEGWNRRTGFVRDTELKVKECGKKESNI